MTQHVCTPRAQVPGDPPSSTGRGLRRSVGALLAFLLPLLCPLRIDAQQPGLRPVLTANTPVFVTHAGDARLFVVEQGGRILVHRSVDAPAEEFLDLSKKVRFGGEQGLLSMAFHPDYARTGWFYVNYTDREGATVVERYRVAKDPNKADPQSGATLLRIGQPFINHNGGQLQVGPDGHLYVGMGDGGSGFDPLCSGQDPKSLLGKLLRLNIRQHTERPPYHGIPNDNPFVGDPRVPDVIYALGLRNPWRFSFDRQTGELYIADVGQLQREEVDALPLRAAAGANFGWRTMEGSRCLERPLCDGAPACGDRTLVAPVYEYDHQVGCSITGGYVYRGKRIPELQGTYVFGDYCSGIILGLRKDESGKYQARTLIEKAGPKLTTFGEDAAGELYVALDNQVFTFVAGEAGGGQEKEPGAGEPAGHSKAERQERPGAGHPAPGLRALEVGVAIVLLLGTGIGLWAQRRA